jgi:hypothetical protein
MLESYNLYFQVTIKLRRLYNDFGLIFYSSKIVIFPNIYSVVLPYCLFSPLYITLIIVHTDIVFCYVDVL